MTGNDLPVWDFDIGDIPTVEQDSNQDDIEVKHEVKEPDVKPEPEVKDDKEEDKFEIKQGNPYEVEAQQEPEEDTSKGGDERYKSLYSFYKDEGLITIEDEFDGSKEAFAEILKKQRFAEQEAFQTQVVEAMPEYAQNLVEYILTEGDTLTVSKLKEFLDISEQAGSLPDIGTDENKAKEYLIDKFSKLHGADMAKKFVEALEDDGDLLDKATAELERDKEELAKAERAKVEQSKQAKLKQQQAQADFAKSLETELKSTGWKPEVQQNVYNEIFSQNLRQKTSGIVQHPKALIKLANYLRYYDPATGDIDETAFAKTAYSGAAKDLKSNIEKHFNKSDAFGGGTVATRKQDKNETFVFAE